MSEIKQRVLQNNIAGAIQLCSDQGAALGAKVAKAGLLRASRDNNQITSAIEIECHEAVGSLRKRVAYLAMLANVATLFGLLGTVYGLIKSFAAVASVDAATKSMLLAEGISVSMNATASGLAVAIPTMIAFSILQSKSNRLVEQVETVGMSVQDILGSRVYREEWDEAEKPATPAMGGKSSKEKAA
jgi:biopolymer transport protein ExbB/TolQ